MGHGEAIFGALSIEALVLEPWRRRCEPEIGFAWVENSGLK
jgi:hypothetical protein